jgi:tellurite resistance protein TerB
MGFFDDAFDAIKDGIDKAVVEGKKFMNKGFLKATVAACVRVAAADGNIDSDEKRKTLEFIGRNEHLKVFKSKDVVKIFNECTEHLDFDATIGIGELNKMIAPLKGKPEAALLVQVCCAVGEADGNFDDDEKRVVREIAGILDMHTSI